MNWIFKILNQWSISPVVKYSQINDRVYEITCTDQKRYILKRRPYLYKLDNEYHILQYLSSNNIPVPLPLPTMSGDYYAIIEDQGYTLYDYILGKSIEYNLEEDNKNLSYTYGEMLGKYHYRLSKYKGPIGNIDIFNQQKYVINYTKEEINKKLPISRTNEIMDDTYNELKVLCDKMPRQLIHRDINLNNILFYNDRVSGIIDFDPLVIGYKTFDLCFLILHLLGHIYDTERLKKWLSKIIPKILSGYKSENSLDMTELASIWYYLVLIEMYYAAFKFSVNAPEAEKILNIAYWIYDNEKDVIKELYEIK